MNTTYRPLLFRRRNGQDAEAMDQLLLEKPHIESVDTIYAQLGELIKVRNPTEKITDDKRHLLIMAHVQPDTSLEDYGVWAYYPWLNKIVHLLDEEEFIEVRTNRNVYKISFEEVQALRKKKIGVIGLSVGQSVAVTMAMERICGELRLGDFDTLELSNMNRIRAGVHHLGENKTIITARQIAEMDPYIQVSCYSEGINFQNIDDFLTGNGALDMLVEECDGIDVKILSRLKAREFGIPVIMDTNDKGMLDIERFDLERDRPIFHGRLSAIEGQSFAELEKTLKDLTIQQKIQYLVEIIGMENVSEAMKLSLQEMNRTITGWPQLASAVMLGGAMVTDVTRRSLLGKFSISGRYFVDFEDLIQEEKAN
ncbi:ThiF family adenylyltransferase [Parapedobacter lycopersici]|uniref:ThiF family adenylyltransferase n=1 Tax=Parapedobacter lycopersici TaxID=1864939 RepID=UPI00214D13F9|nr:ThiF family adenylyltransferase [Parapedobacter lycopersici]